VQIELTKFGANPSKFEPPIYNLTLVGLKPLNLDKFSSPSSSSLLSCCVLYVCVLRMPKACISPGEKVARVSLLSSLSRRHVSHPFQLRSMAHKCWTCGLKNWFVGLHSSSSMWRDNPTHWLQNHKNIVVCRCCWLNKPTQGQSDIVHTCHSQQRRWVYPIMVKSLTPRPPNSTDLATLDHATRHLPPWTESVPVQMKVWWYLSIIFLIHRETLTAMEKCSEMVESVIFVWVVRPTCDMKCTFQLGSLSATSSANGCRSDLCSLYTVSGTPKVYTSEVNH
jgi:hypothetical protein